MIPKVVIITTKKGFRYGDFVAKEINLRGFRCELTRLGEVFDLLVGKRYVPEETLIHTRTASPVRVYKALKRLEKDGYRVINKADTVKRTSDKFLACQLALKKGIVSPKVWRIRKEDEQMVKEKVVQVGKVVVKPITSQEAGKYCFAFNKDNLQEVVEKMALMPNRDLFLQEFVDYQRLYRVIVIGFQALEEAVFYDEPKQSWKASVCLNPSLSHEKNPSKELLVLAEKISRLFEAEICFIDIFQTKKDWVLNEINTACSLIIHERKSKFNISARIAEYLISQIRI
ncbi:hypothetical protein ISS86_00950 [Candidatus Microgenomates bacterium]|nr:hypothetical protein [Candidatus Microgenomates bacterium]